MQLLDNGANPEALAALITELQSEARRIQSAENGVAGKTRRAV